jgi:hypothetical protein
MSSSADKKDLDTLSNVRKASFSAESNSPEKWAEACKTAATHTNQILPPRYEPASWISCEFTHKHQIPSKYYFWTSISLHLVAPHEKCRSTMLVTDCLCKLVEGLGIRIFHPNTVVTLFMSSWQKITNKLQTSNSIKVVQLAPDKKNGPKGG